MLELRPTCEQCNKELPPHSLEAMICSFECTFCKTCAVDIFQNICPNCGGNFYQRPIRQAQDIKNNNDLKTYPATKKITYKPKKLPL